MEPITLDDRLHQLIRASLVEALEPTRQHMQSLDQHQKDQNSKVAKLYEANQEHALFHAHASGVKEGKAQVQAVITRGQLTLLGTVATTAAALTAIIPRFLWR